MAHALTDYSGDVINRLIKTGRYNNRSEVVRAGLRLLEEREFGYLRPQPLSANDLLRAYRRQQREAGEEQSAVKASRRRKPRFDE